MPSLTLFNKLNAESEHIDAVQNLSLCDIVNTTLYFLCYLLNTYWIFTAQNASTLS